MNSIGAEADERKRQQVFLEAKKAVLVLGTGFAVAVLIGFWANSLPVRTSDDFIAAQNLRVYALLVFMIASATWVAWFHRPSPRLGMIANLAKVAKVSREIESTEGDALRRRKRKKLRSACRVAFRTTPSRHNYKSDLFYQRHYDLLRLIETTLLTLEWRAARSRFDDLAQKDLRRIAETIEKLIFTLWSNPEEIDNTKLASASDFSEAVGKPPRSRRERIVEVFSVISIRDVVRLAAYLLIGLAISGSILVPAIVFLGSSPASILAATFALAATMAGLLQTAHHRQKE